MTETPSISPVEKPFYVIGICTRHRNALLERLLRSLWSQPSPQSARIEVVIMDNAESPSVPANLFDLPEKFPIHLHHEPRAGLVFARNALFNVVEGLGADAALCIDDDVEVADDWLEAWILGLQRLSGEILIGTTTFIYDGDISPLHPQKQFPVRREAARPAVFSGANFAIRRRLIDATVGEGLRFDLDFNNTGGEDSEIMLRAERAHGAAVQSCPTAKVTEIREGGRVAMHYQLQRRYRDRINGLRIFRKHQQAGIKKDSRPFWLHVLVLLNRNVFRGLQQVLIAAARFPFNQTASQRNLGSALEHFARIGGIFGYFWGKTIQEYGQPINRDSV